MLLTELKALRFGNGRVDTRQDAVVFESGVVRVGIGCVHDHLDLHSRCIRTGRRGYDDGRKGRVLGMDGARDTRRTTRKVETGSIESNIAKCLFGFAAKHRRN